MFYNHYAIAIYLAGRILIYPANKWLTYFSQPHIIIKDGLNFNIFFKGLTGVSTPVYCSTTTHKRVDGSRQHDGWVGRGISGQRCPGVGGGNGGRIEEPSSTVVVRARDG